MRLRSSAEILGLPKRSVLLSCGRFDTCRRSTLSCWRRTRISATSFVVGLKNEAMMWRISRRNSIIRWQGYRVSASRLAESNFRYAQDSEHADFDAAVNVAHNDQETEVVPPAQEPEEMPLPSDPKVIFLGGLFVLALLATAYVASEIVLPLVFAIILKLLLQPALRILERLHVPRMLAALLLSLALFGTIVGLGTAISGPAGTWAAKLPEGIPRLQERLSFMREPINTLQRFLQQVENFGGTGSPNAAASAWGPTLLTKLFTGTRNFASGFFTTVLFLFFLLVSADIFLHRLVEILPRFSNKRQVVEISQQIESDISAYLITITIMNAAVGIAMALAMWLTGVGDPI